MKKLLLGLALSVSVISSTVAQTEETSKNSGEFDKIVAIINDAVVTQNQLNQQLSIIKEQLRLNNIATPSEQVLKQQVLQQLINVEMQVQLAKQLGLIIEDTELDQAIEGIAQNNNFTLEQFKQEIATAGLEFEQYRENIKKEMLLSRLQQQAVSHLVKISDQEVEHFLKANANQINDNQEFRIENILIPLPSVPSSEQLSAANKKANEILQQLKAGENFNTIAVSASSGTHALQGGDLGWRKLAALPEIFSEKVVQLEKDEIAGPIRANNGLHIIKLADVRGEELKHMVSLSQVRHILIQPKANELKEDAIARINAIKQRIEKGEDFAVLAKESSLDPLSADQGGDLGWVGPGKLSPKFEQAMNQLAPGVVSDAVETEFGYHLIQVLSRKEVDDTEAFVKEQVRQQLFQRKFTNETNNWLMQLRQSVNIQILEEQLKN